MSIAVAPSSRAWIAAAVADVATLLVDHAHCERKAADTALRWMQRYSDRPALQRDLSRLAREELVHFERVLKELERRGIKFNAMQSSGYAAALFAATKNTAGGAERSRDEMLVCALIEARSHERFVRLIEAPIDAELRALYEDLADAEARHGDLYLDLANEFANADVAPRLAILTQHEAEVIARPKQPLRMHAGG